MNSETRPARTYHEQTKHSYWSVRTTPHTLDWANRPLQHKLYETLEPIPLPRPPGPETAALDAVAMGESEGAPYLALTLDVLAQVLYLSNGVTRVLRRHGEVYAFRAASCTGALYHIELYVVCRELPGLPAGVYHYGAHDHALRRVREGDFRAEITRATAGEPQTARAPAVVICTDTFWRNAWKYRSRAYRHSGWDTGVILANLLATAAGVHLPARVVCGFTDEAVNRLLSIDGAREASVALVALGRDEQVIDADGSAISSPPVDLPTTPLSRTEVEYPLIREIHNASSLSLEKVPTWRGAPPARPEPPASGRLFPLSLVPDGHVSRDPLDAVIKRRGSSRRFTHEPITFGDLSTMLQRSTRSIPADFLAPSGTLLNDVYVIVNAVDGLPAGAYMYHRDAQALEQVREGEFRGQAGYLALEQALARDAAVNIYYLAALGPILERFGNRGYRAVQLEAGILGGKVYLLSYALGLGATGLTFYDDEVTRFFSPHAAGKSVIFLMAVGHSGGTRARHPA